MVKKYGLIYEVVMRDINKWKEFFNEVAAACNYWELGFGDINAALPLGCG